MRRRSRAGWLQGAACRAVPVRRYRWSYASPAGSPAPDTHRLAWSVVPAAHRRARVWSSTLVHLDRKAGRGVAGHVDLVRGRPVTLPGIMRSSQGFAAPSDPSGPSPTVARPATPSGSTGRRPDTSSTGESAVGILAAMVGNLQLATTRLAAARGPARPGETSGSPSADSTCPGLPHAQRRMATVRPEIPHRSRPPPRRGDTPFACGTANPRADAYVWRDRPSPHAARPVQRLLFERSPPPSRPASRIPGDAHRPTLDPGPFLLQISTPLV